MIARAGRPLSLVIYLPDLSGGGAERLHIRLASEFVDAGWDVTFLLDQSRGELLDAVPAGCKTIVLGASRQIAALPKLVGFLRRTPPDVMIVNMEHMNVMAVAARAIARASTKIVATQHIALSQQIKRPSWQWRMLPALYRKILPLADAVVAVSEGVADDLSAVASFPRGAITVIHNGVVTRDFAERAAEEPDHPWFQDDVPIVLAMGRMVPQKDFGTLIEAFARLRETKRARLIILGDGPLRADLEAQRERLHLGDVVAMPGFVENPLPSLRRASLFVLSSRFEGFGNVLAEALACGTPCVSTDCPHGPSEILDGGRYGRLVPVADVVAMADAMSRSLSSPSDREALRSRGSDFSVERCADQYVALIERLAA